MDIITHIAIGAVVGELVLGKKLGKKALFWGALGGIIPDLDMFIYPFLEKTQALLFHRSYSHSLLFLIVISPLVGWILSLLNKKEESIKPKHWAILILVNGVIHVSLDIFTGYGTGIFLPFSDARIALATISPIDVFFSVPLWITFFMLIFLRRGVKIRVMILWFAITVSVLYIPYTIINKAHANSIFEKALHSQNKKYFQVKAYPQIPANFVWLCVAKTCDGYWVGYYNQFKKDSIQFRFVPKNDYWLIDYEKNPKIVNLKRFSKNEYSVVRKENGDFWFTILRFGWLGTSPEAESLMTYIIKPKGNDLLVSKYNPPLHIKN